MRKLIPIIIAVMLILASYIVGREEGKRAAYGTVNTQTDTLYLRDTIRIPEPKEIAHTIVREMEVEVPVYIHTRDTIVETVYVPREERIYEDSTYYAVVSGVDPRLDYLEIMKAERVITKTVTERVRPRWSVGVQGGYGIGRNGLTPYVGVGLQYNVISFGYRRDK